MYKTIDFFHEHNVPLVLMLRATFFNYQTSKKVGTHIKHGESEILSNIFAKVTMGLSPMKAASNLVSKKYWFRVANFVSINVFYLIKIIACMILSTKQLTEANSHC